MHTTEAVPYDEQCNGSLQVVQLLANGVCLAAKPLEMTADAQISPFNMRSKGRVSVYPLARPAVPYRVNMKSEARVKLQQRNISPVPILAVPMEMFPHSVLQTNHFVPAISLVPEC